MIDSPAVEIDLTRVRRRSPLWWVVGALAVGMAVALAEVSLREMQSALLIYFLASFWVALPRRAPALAIVGVIAAAPFLTHAITGTPANWSAIATVSAVILGACAGAVGGIAFAELDAPVSAERAGPAREEPRLRARVLLPLALTAFAALGISPVWASLRWGGLLFGFVPVPRIQLSLIAVRWAQALTLVGWVLLTPVVLRARQWLRREEHGDALTPGEALRHLGFVTLIAALHAGALAVIGTVAGPRSEVFFGPPPAAVTLWRAIVAAYGPFDLLTYIAILGLAHLTDRARQADEARRRAAALEAAAVTARLAALKARLDPHFLYNALNAAVTLARRGRGDETSRVLEELTAILRYVLDDTRGRVSLRDELAFVRRYLEIMQLRFGTRLTFAINSDPDAMDVFVPPLVLQPLVENAVEHGVANANGPVNVGVDAHRTGRALVITVQDDGPGPNAGWADGAGIGLGATRERLAIMFGDRASVTLAPRSPRGAVTELRLPVTEAAAP